MKALLSTALLLWFFGVLFFLNRAKADYCGVPPGITSPSLAAAGLPVISFDHYSYKPDTSAAFHLLRDSLLNNLQNTDRLTITAHYTKPEADTDRNLGLKRANAIRSLFDGYEGFERIEIDSKLSEKVSTSTIFEISSDILTQNALDTPIPPMMDEKDAFAGIRIENGVPDLIAEETTVKEPVAITKPVNEEYEKEVIVADNKNVDYVIYFDDASSKMINAGEVLQYLDGLSKRIKKSKEILEIRGFDDNSRSSAESLELAQRRTWRVRKAFTDKYVRRKLVHVENIGQSDPVASNSTPDGRSKNRRVEIKILKK